jgi:dienelactone hydrolase
MAEVLLFHHAHGLTPGVRDLAATLEGAGHAVHVPDLFGGRVFDDLEAGVAFAQEVGFGTILERARTLAHDLPDHVVHAGLSLGVVPAQMLAQTRPGARGALFIASCLPTSEFGDGWPAAVPVQVHGMDADPYFAGEGDLDAARALVAEAPDAELFLYAGQEHLFMDPGLAAYVPAAAAELTERVLAFLDRVS